MTALDAILVIGPTGVGKTPFGDHLEAGGFRGKRVHHFDFGAELRAAAEAPVLYPRLDETDAAVIRRVLETGALLEDDQFHIVEKLFAGFAARRRAGSPDWVLLNGVPRHVGQAEDVRRFASVRYVVGLSCDDTVVQERIRTNAGGDRTGRVDDAASAVAKKLALFKKRTAPLVAYYRAAGAVVVAVPVDTATGPAAIAGRLDAYERKASKSCGIGS